MGLFSALALAKASELHGYQSTGLVACWRRYGLASPARRFKLGVLAAGDDDDAMLGRLSRAVPSALWLTWQMVDESADGRNEWDQFGEVLAETQENRPADVSKASRYNMK